MLVLLAALVALALMYAGGTLIGRYLATRERSKAASREGE